MKTRRRKRRVKLAASWARRLALLASLCWLSSSEFPISVASALTPSAALLRHLHHRHQPVASGAGGAASAQVQVLGNLCSLLPVQVSRQLRLCKLMQGSQGAAEAVRNGTASGLLECRRLFQEQRWNCTHLAGDHQLLAGDFTQTLGLRESAFVQAITAAGLVHSVASACSLGHLRDCACDRTRLGTIRHHEEKWKWGGCSHNIRQGMQFAKYHVELLEALHQHERGGRHSPLGQQQRHFRHHQTQLQAGKQEAPFGSVPCPGPHQNLSRASQARLVNSLLAPDSLERHHMLRLAVNMHNNRVGRMAVANNMELKCRCHGLSGSCSMKTCWLALPELQQVGAYLKRKYDSALQLTSAVPLGRLVPMMDRDELVAVLAGGGDDERPPVAPAAGQSASPDLQLNAASLLRDLKLCGAGGSRTQPPANTQGPTTTTVARQHQHQHQLQHQWSSNTGHLIRAANQQLAQALVQARSKDDLLYLHRSPDFCQPQPALGFAGLSGRLCQRNATANREDTCDRLCCPSAGFSLRAIHYPYTCDCKFQYCCSILCKQCEETAEFHVCN